MSTFKVFRDNLVLYSEMLKDIKAAKRYIYLETYMFNADNIGRKFVNALAKKAKEGVEVRVIIDDIGSNADMDFFATITAAGGYVRIFQSLRVSRLLKQNNQRDHRKILAIDDEVSYIGSSNITDSTLNWRESTIRFSNGCGVLLRNAFLENFQLSKNIIYRGKTQLEQLVCDHFEVVRDVPSLRFKKIRKRIIGMINKAKKEVLIETPYFLPNRKLRNALRKAIRRGVTVRIMLPNVSDVKVVDILRERYLGRLHRAGVEFVFYTPDILHSKLILVDRRFYGIGSHNLDFRSDLLQFEIMLFGDDKAVVEGLRKGFESASKDCKPFRYAQWKRRGWFQKVMERLLIPLRYWF